MTVIPLKQVGGRRRHDRDMTKETKRSKTPESIATSDAAEKATRRSFVARPIGSILPSITRPAFSRQNTPAVRLMLEWEAIVGPALAAQTTPRRIAAGTLTVACAGPVAMEIQHLAPQLIERINGYFGTLPRSFDRPGGARLVERIRPVQDAAMAVAALPVRRPAPRPVDIANMADGPLRDVLSRLGGQVAARRSRR